MTLKITKLKNKRSCFVCASDSLALHHWHRSRELLSDLSNAYVVHGTKWLEAFAQLLDVSPYMVNSSLESVAGFLADLGDEVKR